MKLINCSFDEFVERVSNNKIYCFGYGVVSKLFLDILQEADVAERISAFVDNSKEKIGTIQNYNGLDYKIISSEQLREEIQNEFILITCSDVEGILSQLNEVEELRNTECYSMHLMLSRQDSNVEFNGVLRREKEQCIPKKIHYCWFGGNPMPPKNKRWLDSWKKYCPDYEIIEWNEDNYDYKKNSYMEEAYSAQKWGFVSDYARLDIVYNYGGIYLDTDVEILGNLDELLYQEAFSSFDVQRHVNLGNGFGAVKGHPLVKELRDYYEDKKFIDENGRFDLTTCVTHQHNVLRKYGIKPDGKYQVVQGMTIYPAGINGVNAYSLIQEINENTLFMHYGTASWSTQQLTAAREKRVSFLKDILQNNE